MGPQRVLFLAFTLVLGLGFLTLEAQAQTEEFHAFLLPAISHAEIDQQVVVTFEVDSTPHMFQSLDQLCSKAGFTQGLSGGFPG